MPYKFEVMSREAMESFLSDKRHAVASVVRKDGSPHSSAIWYKYIDGKILFIIQADSVKHQILKRDPRISICIDGQHPDLRVVVADGTATLEPCSFDQDRKLSLYRRYYDDDESYLDWIRLFHSWGKAILVTVTPHKIRSQDYTAVQ